MQKKTTSMHDVITVISIFERSLVNLLSRARRPLRPSPTIPMEFLSGVDAHWLSPLEQLTRHLGEDSHEKDVGVVVEFRRGNRRDCDCRCWTRSRGHDGRMDSSQRDHTKWHQCDVRDDVRDSGSGCRASPKPEIHPQMPVHGRDLRHWGDLGDGFGCSLDP